VRGELSARTASAAYDPDHHTRIKLNGQLVEDALWEGIARHAFQGQVAQSTLLNASNTFQVNAIQDAYEGEVSQDFYLDWFEVTYERLLVAYGDELAFSEDQGGDWHYQTFAYSDNSPLVYALDVTQPLAPSITLLTSSGGVADLRVSVPAGEKFFLAGSHALRAPVSVRAYAPPELLTSANGADYIIITAPEFASAVQRLADQRIAQGLRVKIVLLQDVIDQFNEGIYHPLAIKSFLSYAYTHWQPPAPAFVLLVGDGNFNLLNNNPAQYGSTNPIYMPPNLEFVDFTNGEIDATNNLANIVGSDMMPDIAIGRLPVNSVGELDTVIDKILAYENGAKNQSWQRHVMLVADNTPDSAGNFPAFADDLVTNYLPAPFVGDKVYLDDLSCPPLPGDAGSCPQVSAAILNGLNNTGALFVTYIGHGHTNRWTGEQVLNNTIAATMTNSHLPVALAMTCYEGYWSLPNNSALLPGLSPTLSELMLLNPTGGTVSSFSPTGWGTTYDHHLMERGIFEAVFTNSVDRLGPATDLGKLDLFASGSGVDVIQTFLVLGDPALKLHIPPHAAFSAAPLSGEGSLEVSFTSQSTGDFTTLTWNFGDGTPVSHAVNPVHTYASYGVYTVTLTVDDGPGNSDSEVKAVYIGILPFKLMLPVVLG
jgi:hypothetical protein